MFRSNGIGPRQPSIPQRESAVTPNSKMKLFQYRLANHFESEEEAAVAAKCTTAAEGEERPSIEPVVSATIGESVLDDASNDWMTASRGRKSYESGSNTTSWQTAAPRNSLSVSANKAASIALRERAFGSGAESFSQLDSADSAFSVYSSVSTSHVKCFVRRDRSSFHHTYTLFLEAGERPLLFARKSKQRSYHIFDLTTTEQDVDISTLMKDSSAFIGKVFYSI